MVKTEGGNNHAELLHSPEIDRESRATIGTEEVDKDEERGEYSTGQFAI